MTTGSKQRASKEVREADVFLRYSGEFLKWMQKNVQLILALVGILIVAGSLYAGFGWWTEKKEYEAQEALFKVEKDYFDLKEKFDTAEADYERQKEEASKAKKKIDVEKPEALPSGDLQKDYGDILKRFEQFMAAHSGTNAEVMAAMQIAKIYSQYENYAEAEKVLAPIVKKNEGADLLAALASVMLGTVVEAQGRCEKAIDHWQGVVSVQAASALHSDVLLRQALCHENLSNKEKARELYRKLETDYADSQAGKRAKSYLRWLELQGE